MFPRSQHSLHSDPPTFKPGRAQMCCPDAVDTLLPSFGNQWSYKGSPGLELCWLREALDSTIPLYMDCSHGATEGTRRPRRPRGRQAGTHSLLMYLGEDGLDPRPGSQSHPSNNFGTLSPQDEAQTQAASSIDFAVPPSHLTYLTLLWSLTKSDSSKS